jgi:hypothetical protein
MLQNINKSFYELLNKELTKDVKNELQKCLISDEPLNNTKITLVCNHSFNYYSLFKEIKIQKTRYNNLETQRLKKNEIKCPYCRNTQNGILPYKVGDTKIKYVNWPENLAYKPYKCSYTFLSGKKKNEHCNRPSCDKYCKQHERIINNRKLKQVTITNTVIKEIQTYENNTIFVENKQKYTNWLKNNIHPTIYHTKNYSYFRCRCQHIINKGKKNEKQCSKYMICSDKLYKNNSISPKYYRRYLCSTHNYKNDHIVKMNTISFPKKIHIDLLNIPKNTEINFVFLSKFYNKFFHSNSYNYKKFNSFTKKSLENNSIIKNIEHLIVM